MQSYEKSPHGVAMRLQRRSIILLSSLAISIVLLVALAAAQRALRGHPQRHSSGSTAGTIHGKNKRKGAKKHKTSLVEMVKDEISHSKAALEEYSEVAGAFAQSLDAVGERIAAMKAGALGNPSIPLSLFTGGGDKAIAAWGELIAGDEGAAALVEAKRSREEEMRDPAKRKAQLEAMEAQLKRDTDAKIKAHVAEVLSSLKEEAAAAKHTVLTEHVAAVRAQRFADPKGAAPQWRNGGGGQGGYDDVQPELGPGDAGYYEQQQEKMKNRHKNNDNNQQNNNNNNGGGGGGGNAPAWGWGEAVDPNDRMDNRVNPNNRLMEGDAPPPADPNNFPHGGEHVVPRQDRQFAPQRKANLNDKPLGEYGGIVRQAGDQFVDYDNDFYNGVVNDVPGPARPQPPDPLDTIEDEGERNERRAEAVKEAFVHSWKGYHNGAWGCDESKPRSRTCKNWNEADGGANGFGLTILDGMTTAYLMGLDDIVKESLGYIKANLRFSSIDVDGSLFETNIRALGGLLSMYELTGEKHRYLLDKAVEVADILLFAFNTTTGIPHSTVNFKSRRHFGSPWGGGNSILSELGTVQLEFRTLSYHTKNPVYDMKATHVMSIIEAKAPQDFLCPLYISHSRLTWAVDHVSLGALGDSFYEYIIKQYLLTGNTEEKYARMSVKMLKGLSKLLFRSKPSNMLYVAEHRARFFHHKMDHLACFVGGMFALLAKELPDLTDAEAAHIMKLAGDLTETCVKMYTMQVTGVSPEYVEFPAGADFVNGQGFYILRPEATESVFYMYRYTKDAKWREYGWRMFKAINRYCRVPYGGYVGIREVNVADPPQDNLMQSFWLAETLKYFHLLFSDDETLDLNEWVFNTEAHPLRRRERDPLDVWRAYEDEHGQVPWFPPPLQGIKNVETAKMVQMRRAGTANMADMKADPLSGDTGEEGMPDDEGLPFDEVKGPLGIVRDRRTMTDFLLQDEGKQFNFKKIRKNGRFV